MAEGHEHYWAYPHGCIQGRSKNEIAVVRYCGGYDGCGRREVAFAKVWTKATGDYALDEHYNLVSDGQGDSA